MLEGELGIEGFTNKERLPNSPTAIYGDKLGTSALRSAPQQLYLSLAANHANTTY